MPLEWLLNGCVAGPLPAASLTIPLPPANLHDRLDVASGNWPNGQVLGWPAQGPESLGTLC